MAMDIPVHILDAVSVSDLSQPSPRIPGLDFKANSSADDVSSTSHSDQEHGYQTDLTTPSSAGDVQSNEVEDFRDREYPQLKGKTYLDHGGTTLYAKSLIEDFSADMIANLYGNPHSASTPSAIAGHRVDTIRERALRFFGADPQHFDLVFVANATAAIKLVVDCFRDYAAASNTPIWYGYHRDAHTSLVGVRESTRMHRCFTSDEEVDIWINSGGLGGPRPRQLGLFAYPGQSNMTGRRLPLSWPGRIRKSLHKAATYTLFDAAALASTAPLDLSDPTTAPDFVALSFYKIFGFPNIGALIVRKESAHVLQSRKFFGGGTVEMVISINDTWHAKKDTSIHDRLEDGTLPFHSIFALDHAMNVHERLYGPDPMKFISHHTAQLGKLLYDGLSLLQHSNGQPLCRIYKDEAAVYGDPSVQGATVAFNVQRPDGSLIGFQEVEEAADERGIYVRSGSLCNPGGVATYLNWSPAEMKAAYAAGHRCSSPTQIMLGKATGVVRVSLGAMNITADVYTFLGFLESMYIRPAVPASVSTEHASAAITSILADDAWGGSAYRYTQLPALSVPSGLDSPGITSNTFTSTYTSDTRTWEAGITNDEKPKNPPFNPAEYLKSRKPWEEEMRKNAAAYAMDVKIREAEDATMFVKCQTPSVKARKFGRSVVSLWRNKKPPMSDSTTLLPPELHLTAMHDGAYTGRPRQHSHDGINASGVVQSLGIS